MEFSLGIRAGIWPRYMAHKNHLQVYNSSRKFSQWDTFIAMVKVYIGIITRDI